VPAAPTARPARPLLSIVVPLFDEEAVVPALAERITRCAAALDADVEIVAVDDGSRDRTGELLRDWAKRDARVVVLVFARNFGHQMALSAGLEEARGEVVALLDGDLQDPPELLPEMLARWRAGFDVVYGVRRNRQEGLLLRGAYALFYRLLRRAAQIDIPLDAGDFCLLDQRVVDVLVALPERSRFLRGLRSWTGFRQAGLPYDRAPRAGGRPKYTWRPLVELGLDGIVSFSHLPLRLASWLGFATAALALAALAFYFVWWLAGFELGGRRPQDVAGFMTLTTLLLFFAGVQLLSLGLLGEYVGRIFVEVKRRPGWIVAERIGGGVSRP
jgi:dolichol-phosphate mannosyltransferase